MRLRTMLAMGLCAVVTACGGGGAPPAVPDHCSAADLLVNAQSCGVCGNVCPDQPNSGGPACVQGVCGRLPCNTGWMDLRPDVPGCETKGDPPVSESGLVFATLTAGGTIAEPATSADHKHLGALGEPTPAPEAGGVSTQNTLNQNVTGFNSILH